MCVFVCAFVGFTFLGVVYLIQNRLHTSSLIQLVWWFYGWISEHVRLSCCVCTLERATQWIICALIWYGCSFVHHIGRVCSLFSVVFRHFWKIYHRYVHTIYRDRIQFPACFFSKIISIVVIWEMLSHGNIMLVNF